MIIDGRAEIMEEDRTFEKAKQKAFRLLSVRGRSVKELRSRLKEKGFEESVVGKVITRLTELEYLDDEFFAREFTRDLAVNKLYGNRRIEVSLLGKGIDRKFMKIKT
jgi:regulatory protein